MADIRKPLTVHYRRLADPTNAFGGKSLQASISQALNVQGLYGPIRDHWKHRAWTPEGDSSHTYLMNIFSDQPNFFFGDLTQYTAGYMQSLLRHEEDAPMLSVEQSPAPAGREYIHSIMYWMVINDHLLAIQSLSMTTRSLEGFLTWLLKDHTSTISSTGHVILNAKFDPVEVGGDLDDIKEIVVGGTGIVAAAEERPPEQYFRETESHTDIGSRRPWGQRALDVLKAVMSSEADVQKLLSELPKGADLEVSVHIGYKSKKRKLSRASMQNALRNLSDGEIVARGPTGKMTGKDIRLSFPVRVVTKNGLPDVNDVRAKLFDAYQYFVSNGKIQP